MELTYIGIVTKVNKKTAAKGFKVVKVGDEVKLAWDLDGGYHGAPYVVCYINGKFADTKNADTVWKLFKGKHGGEPNFTLEEVTK